MDKIKVQIYNGDGTWDVKSYDNYDIRGNHIYFEEMLDDGSNQIRRVVIPLPSIRRMVLK